MTQKCIFSSSLYFKLQLVYPIATLYSMSEGISSLMPNANLFQTLLSILLVIPSTCLDQTPYNEPSLSHLPCIRPSDKSSWLYLKNISQIQTLPTVTTKVRSPSCFAWSTATIPQLGYVFLNLPPCNLFFSPSQGSFA